MVHDDVVYNIIYYCRPAPNAQPSRQEVLDTLPTFWPICTILISVVQITMFIAVCVVFGLAPISFVPEIRRGEVLGFNGLNVSISRQVAPNFFVGPPSEALVHVGAQYTPVSVSCEFTHMSCDFNQCMRENVEFLVEAARARNQELNLRCCRTRLGNCGMVPLNE